jgi:RNA polymerase sigma factor (sigma-70 family)
MSIQTVVPPHTEDAPVVLDAVERALDGDRQAIDLLYRRFATNVYGLARSIVRDDHEAEDVTQQVFIKLMTSLGTFRRSRGTFQSWLLRMARNTAIDHIRCRPPVFLEHALLADLPAPDERSAIGEVVTAALAALPLGQRRVIVLLHLGLSSQEVAEALGLSEGAVYGLRHRARRSLCRHLVREGVTPHTRGRDTTSQFVIAPTTRQTARKT